MLVDWDRISLLADPNDPEDQAWLQETMANLSSDINEKVSGLNSLYTNKAWEELKASLHQMRGVASNFGLTELANLSNQAEDSIRNSEFAKTNDLVQKIQKVWLETKEELQKKFSSI